jgi:hypothetical protein
MTAYLVAQAVIWGVLLLLALLAASGEQRERGQFAYAPPPLSHAERAHTALYLLALAALTAWPLWLLIS